jgi:hypothetical protein
VLLSLSNLLHENMSARGLHTWLCLCSMLQPFSTNLLMELVKLLQLIAQSWLLHVPSTGIFAAPGACTALLPFVATQFVAAHSIHCDVCCYLCM